MKNSVIGDERNLERKIPEAAIAIRLERQLSKDEILEAYLNTVYFGSGAYGVRAAAEIYFGTTPDRLTWPQSALLASLIANPGRFDPTLFPDRARERRAIALTRLLETGHIDDSAYQRYLNASLPSSRNVAAEWEPTNYFIEEVRRRLLDDPRLGATEAARAELLFGGGLRVHTTYDPAAQLAAEAAIDGLLPDDERAFAAALAALEPGTGHVRALVGGPGFEVFEFNIATQKGRPTGSSFKPYVLAAAIEKGFVPDDLLNGTGPCEFANFGGFPDPYIANNFGEDDGSVATVRSQTLASSNCAYVRLGLAVGLSNVAATARALGVTTDLSDLPISMPLGPKDVTPLDMATAYATFANDGLQVDPIFITRVEDRQGNVIFENAPRPERAISAQSARLVTSVLEANMRSGTGTRARLPEQAAAGKTGTAQNFADAWFVGYTPYLATAVWMGNPDEQVPMTRVDRGPLGIGSVTGGSLPAMMWGAFNTGYHERLDPVPFVAPASTREGLRIRTDREEDVYSEVIESLCGPGNEDAEIDTDDDGLADYCDPERSEFEFDPGIGECPGLYEPIDLDEDGALEGCTPPTTTTVPSSSSSTTTTTQPLDE